MSKVELANSAASGAVTPLQGALTGAGDSIESTALQLILTRLDNYERQQQAVVRQISNSVGQTNARVEQLIGAMQQERVRSLEAERLLNEKLQRLMEQKRPDPQQLNQMVAAEQKRIQAEIPKRRAEFAERLRNEPRGEIVSDEPQIVRLQANGLHFDIKPAGQVTRNVPKTFIEMWESRKSMKAWLNQLKSDFIIHNQNPKDANHYNALRGLGPLYSPSAGIIG